jgi:two-component system, NarL family, nitrate/nitrite response regulator NarL
VLVTGVHESDGEILGIIEAGADGYETEGASIEHLVANIRALALGQTLCSPHVASLLFARVSAFRVPGSRNEPDPLTRRELEIVALIEQGLCNKDIARQLSLEVQTVKNHVHNILEKLHVHRRIEAARCARAEGLLTGTSVRPM